MVTKAPVRALLPRPTPGDFEWPDTAALRDQLAPLKDPVRSALARELGKCVPMCCTDYIDELPEESIPDLG